MRVRIIYRYITSNTNMMVTFISLGKVYHILRSITNLGSMSVLVAHLVQRRVVIVDV